jgi:hypothetical protein
LVSRRQLTRIGDVQGLLTRESVAPALGVGGELPPASFIAACERARAGPRDNWLRRRERCVGIVPWNLPGRGAEIPGLGLLLPAVGGLVPGGSTVLGLLGLGGGMNGGFEAPIGLGLPGVGGVGVGVCPPGTRCLGPSVAGVCLGTCVQSQVLPGPNVLPGQQQIIPAGGVPTGTVDPYTGQLARPKRRRMNYSNQKALRRALRRATGYARQQKAVKKAAAEFAREFGPKRARSRRDLPRGHTHVR